MKRLLSFQWIIVLTVSLAMSLTIVDAYAAGSPYKNYGIIKTGAFVPTGDLDDADFDTGFNFAVAYGRYLGENLVLEGAFDFSSVEREYRGTTSFTGYYEAENDLSIAALMGSIKVVAPLGKASLYGGVGIGVYFVNMYAEVDTSLRWEYDSDDEYDTVLGFHIVAGGSYDITPRIFIGLEGIYRLTDDVDLEDWVGLPVEVDGNLDGYSITIAVGFRF